MRSRYSDPPRPIEGINVVAAINELGEFGTLIASRHRERGTDKIVTMLDAYVGVYDTIEETMHKTGIAVAALAQRHQPVYGTTVYVPEALIIPVGYAFPREELQHVEIEKYPWLFTEGPRQLQFYSLPRPEGMGITIEDDPQLQATDAAIALSSGAVRMGETMARKAMQSPYDSLSRKIFADGNAVLHIALGWLCALERDPPRRKARRAA